MKLDDSERCEFEKHLLTLDCKANLELITNRVICQDIFSAVKFLPEKFVDLLFIDPPYNLTKTFENNKFNQTSIENYKNWMESWLLLLLPLLKPEASVYICGDWRSSAAIHLLCEKFFIVQNRITFEREKGRGSIKNWKNNSEDIWFCTLNKNYYFDVDSVKLKRKVIAPYKVEGKPKDWNAETDGNYRITHPSNIWTDISIPFWSMQENTPHPTQKPEKLLAKIILASSKENDFIFDPFSGVGTTAVVAKKLNRKFAIVEIEKEYCLFALKRLKLAETDKTIQGFSGGFFWERNTLAEQNKSKKTDD